MPLKDKQMMFQDVNLDYLDIVITWILLINSSLTKKTRFWPIIEMIQ